VSAGTDVLRLWPLISSRMAVESN